MRETHEPPTKTHRAQSRGSQQKPSAGFMVEYLRSVQKKLVCLVCIAVIDEEIDKYLEFVEMGK